MPNPNQDGSLLTLECSVSNHPLPLFVTVYALICAVFLFMMLGWLARYSGSVLGADTSVSFGFFHGGGISNATSAVKKCRSLASKLLCLAGPVDNARYDNQEERPDTSRLNCNYFRPSLQVMILSFLTYFVIAMPVLVSEEYPSTYVTIIVSIIGFIVLPLAVTVVYQFVVQRPHSTASDLPNPPQEQRNLTLSLSENTDILKYTIERSDTNFKSVKMARNHQEQSDQEKKLGAAYQRLRELHSLRSMSRQPLPNPPCRVNVQVPQLSLSQPWEPNGIIDDDPQSLWHHIQTVGDRSLKCEWQSNLFEYEQIIAERLRVLRGTLQSALEDKHSKKGEVDETLSKFFPNWVERVKLRRDSEWRRIFEFINADGTNVVVIGYCRYLLYTLSTIESLTKEQNIARLSPQQIRSKVESHFKISSSATDALPGLDRDDLCAAPAAADHDATTATTTTATSSTTAAAAAGAAAASGASPTRTCDRGGPAQSGPAADHDGGGTGGGGGTGVPSDLDELSIDFVKELYSRTEIAWFRLAHYSTDGRINRSVW